MTGLLLEARLLGANTNTHIILLSPSVLIDMVNPESLPVIPSGRRSRGFMTVALSLPSVPQAV
jgi:hypothetical protein